MTRVVLWLALATGSAVAVADTPRPRSLLANPGLHDTAWVRSTTGLSYTVLREGTGPVALPGQSVTIHEITTLSNGTVLFSTRDKNVPVTFLLGGNQVIAGVEEGVTGMRVGERRMLIVPPSLSTRSSYPPNTPPDSTLRIDLELMATGK